MDTISDKCDDPPECRPRRRGRWCVRVERDLSGGRVPRALIVRTLTGVGRGEDAHGEVRVIVVNDRAMRRLNRRYRGQDKTTDVLSFPFDEEFPVPRQEALLGEIYCNWDHCRRWVAAHGGTVSAELTRLAVHGCLHLLGYDHHNADDRRAMTARENRYLANAGLIVTRSEAD